MATTDALDLMIASLPSSHGARGVSAATGGSLHSDGNQKRSRNVVLPRR